MEGIKFRAWDKLRGEYREVVTLHWDKYNGGLITVRTADPATGHDPFEEVAENFILEPYTGLKDKNGTEIAVGDIVKYDHGFGVYHVVYRKWDSSIVLEDDDREEIIHLMLNEEPRYEVIGNIHENKDLLGEENGRN